MPTVSPILLGNYLATHQEKTRGFYKVLLRNTQLAKLRYLYDTPVTGNYTLLAWMYYIIRVQYFLSSMQNKIPNQNVTQASMTSGQRILTSALQKCIIVSAIEQARNAQKVRSYFFG
jgi:hypothetical protein